MMKNNSRRISVLIPPILLGLVVMALIMLGLTTSRPVTAQSPTTSGQEFVVAATDSSTPTVWISPTKSVVSPGEEFSVTVRVLDTANLGGYEFRMAWNASVLTVTNVVDASFLGSTGRTVLSFGPDIQTDTLTFGAISLGDQPGPDGSGPLAIITLEAIGVGTSTLDLYDMDLFDAATGLPQDPPPAVEVGMVEVEECDPVAITDLASDSPVALGEAMHFTATVTGTVPFTYTWDFGGVGTPTDEDTATPTFLYDAAGAYTVTLTVENPCGQDKETLGVELVWPYQIFLPIVMREYTS